MTKYQLAITSAQNGDIPEARRLMDELPTWDDKVGILHALAVYESDHNGDPYSLLTEAADGIKRIRDESTRGENASWHCYYLTKLGYEAEAFSQLEKLEGPYLVDKLRGYVCIALAKKVLNQPYDSILHKAGELSHMIDESMDEGTTKGLGQAFFRDILSFTWVRRGYKDEVMPYVEKYLTDPVVKQAAVRIFEEEANQKKV